jgi:predicted TIM-barrel fold metal-dependent hydrolase
MIHPRVISADSHVAEPGDLWLRYLEPAFRERAPRLVSEPDADRWYCEGLPPIPGGMTAPAGQRPEEFRHETRYDDGRKGGWDPHARLEDLAVDGVDAEVLYSSVTMLFYRLADIALLNACLRAYNRWLGDYCVAYPDRLKGIGLVALNDVDTAVAELATIRALGLVGVGIGVAIEDERAYDDPRYEPFWSEAEALGLPVSLHVLTTRQNHLQRFLLDYALLPGLAQRSLGAMVLGGVFERHPNLIALSVENDIGWLAHFMERLDHAFHRHRFLRGADGLTSDTPPSAYFRRNVRATFMKDVAGLATRHLIGPENILWASDYPHADSTWPHSQQVIAEQFGGVPEAEKRLITCENAARLYGFAPET